MINIIKKIFTSIIIVVFLVMSLDIQMVYGEKASFFVGDSYLSQKGDVSSLSFSADTFLLPEALGQIEQVNIAEGVNPKTIIHIQDAHCNYYAQHKIADILDYLNKKYGIKTVNLEGG